jgi:hypothetical protein
MSLFVSLILFCCTADGPKVSQVPKAPLDKEGHPDYETALNDKLSKGITSDNNANVLLWKALGPTPEGGKRMPAEFFNRLGIPEPPKDGEYFVELHKYVLDTLKLDQAKLQGLYEEQGWASQRPWTAKDYPHIAGWLKANEKPLAVVMAATKRSEYYNPLISRRNPGDPASLIGSLLPSVQKCREIASALTARAMLQLGEGKTDAAWQDLLAVHRLGRLLSRGGTLIEALVGIAIDAVPTSADLAFLEQAKLTAKQIQECLGDLQNLPALAPMADKIDLLERYTYLDTIELIRRKGINTLEGLSGGIAKKPTEEELKALAMIDWEPAITNGMAWYDRLVATMQIKERDDREKEFDKLDGDLKALKKELATGDNLKKLLVPMPDKAVAKSVSDVLVSLLIPAVRKVQAAHDRAIQFQRNMQVAFALVAYQRDNAKYPAKLADLAPRYLAAVPEDVYSGRTLIYRPTEKGFLVYSVGLNGKDDEGRWFDDTPPGDDPRVRLPLPPLKKGP